MRLRRVLLLLLPLLAAASAHADAQTVERNLARTIRSEVARVIEQQRQDNINDRYTIESVELRGIPARDLTASLDDDRQALVGLRLDADAVAQFATRLREALPDYVITRRTTKGSEQGRLKVIFEARKADWARWIRFEHQDANFIFHSDQGWQGRIPLSINGGDVLVSPLFAIDVQDELVEEYGGFGIRVESRKLGTERLGFLFDWSSFEQTWRGATVEAMALSPAVPALYSHRRSVTPVLKVALTKQVSVEGGVRVTELDALDEGGESRMANAALFAVNFTQRPRNTSGPRHTIEGAFSVRVSTSALESDFSYERYLGQGAYSFRRGRHLVAVSGLAGGLEGDAPLFERFTLGDSRTLRGWDKYDIAPLGGDRVFHSSVEYRYRGFGTFVDAGSVWERGGDRKFRVSTGLTFNPGPVFMTVGFPVNTDEFRAVFTMGLRFSGGFSKY